ncbi:MAG TPA: sorbosone dehydrogenase family protein [Candidatus Acidoferrum sp.]|nr:sorbosone dehydrogenase family protein [Candidatus Acidoferrum sp.]
MNVKLTFAAVGLSCGFIAASASAQVTNGKSPDLPAPFATRSAGNPPEQTNPPQGFLPTVPAGFRVNVFASGFKEARFLAAAPNGDIFLADSGAGEIYILRDAQHSGSAQQREEFASGLNRPFGIAFHEGYVYVGDTDAVLRFSYDAKTSKRTGNAEKLMDLPHGGHWTRNLAFTADGQHLLVAVGSEGNINGGEPPRAAITICDPDGKNARPYATGLRNPVGLAVEPQSGKVWTSVNERDGLGDDLPPDYFTSVQDGGFYGWPYSYIGNHVDPRVNPQKPELVSKAIVPDVLLGAHHAPLQFAFYTGTQFPQKYRGGAFIAEHGSWNRSHLAGYQIAFVAFQNGKAVAGPEEFMTGLVPDPAKSEVYGRLVGVTVASDGSLLVSDDAANIVYRVSVAK